MSQLQTSQINIFPIKSLKGIAVAEAVVEERGFAFDRRWMLVDANNRFISQREHPILATISVAITKAGLFVKRGRAELELPMVPANRRAFVNIWNSHVEAFEYGERESAWFSEQLEMPCRLVVMPAASHRRVDAKYALRPGEDDVSFADGYPYLLIGEGSLADLNTCLLY
ncbi:MAG: MOSC N-terminal beta barrel domain-containing protein, partial [Pyrinomonadaceae bacterium]|nr:MOSC N-terminal beta barrel domain-containing protein [Pyrinomonadaceae bacterium]